MEPRDRREEHRERPPVARFGGARTAGLLMHVTSLPGPWGVGDLGAEARRFVDQLARARQAWWQILPLGPAGLGNCPYQCYSAFAGNPALINPDDLVEDGLLTHADLDALGRRRGTDRADFAAAGRKWSLLARAKERLDAARRPARGGARLRALADDFFTFRSEHFAWLEDFALFMALHERLGTGWQEWPAELRTRKADALNQAARDLAPAVDLHRFAQFLFFRQLDALRAYARGRGIRLIGDLPIYVSGDSADVWARPELFKLDRDRRPTAVAGVPPDLFSETGQLWGNPIYNWPRMERDGFAWWIDRLRMTLRQVDLVRVDHFRGFESFWAVPAGATTAQKGRWVKAPGAALFRACEQALAAGDVPDRAGREGDKAPSQRQASPDGLPPSSIRHPPSSSASPLTSPPLHRCSKLPVIAEDLGVITPAVERLRDAFALPGMKVLQFAFGGDPANPFLPHNYPRNTVAYTGTHDNDTTVGWWRSLSAAQRKRVRRYAPDAPRDPAWALLRLAWASVADTAIAPVQDVLSLGPSARMNLPGTPTGNWSWRLREAALTPQALARLADLTETYGRTAQ